MKAEFMKIYANLAKCQPSHPLRLLPFATLRLILVPKFRCNQIPAFGVFSLDSLN